MESFQREALFYLILGGGVQMACALVLSAFYFPIARRLREQSFMQLLVAYLLFNGFLLVWGCIGHYVFLSIALDTLYVSMDRVVDWFPFIPFGQWVLDRNLGGPHGYLVGGATLSQIRFIWASVALPVWVLTYTCTDFALRHRGFRKPRVTG